MDNQQSGLTILGTQFGCGKTVLMTGLTAMLKEHGFEACAVKPLVSGQSHENEAELGFISAITGSFAVSPISVLSPTMGISEANWQQAIKLGRSVPPLSLVELPGSAATPLVFELGKGKRRSLGWKDSADMARQLGMPCLLVARHDLGALERLVLNAAYVLSKGLILLGLVTVEVVPNGGKGLESLMGRDAFELSLLAQTSIPYLGCIKYSPSISVPKVSQGNLIKSTSVGIELLGVMKALNLTIPVLG